ncbi:MAG: hypothetical protein H6751_13745 [Candidatus Omnitrophica bacterium]|nr:hypothetical protein [Candidatus Omnitrophota bacterium]
MWSSLFSFRLGFGFVEYNTTIGRHGRTFASALTLSGLEEPDNALLVDLNADGALDLVIEQSGKTFVYRNTTLPGGDGVLRGASDVKG